MVLEVLLLVSLSSLSLLLLPCALPHSLSPPPTLLPPSHQIRNLTPKPPQTEFKDRRKAWRDGKKAQAALSTSSGPPTQKRKRGTRSASLNDSDETITTSSNNHDYSIPGKEPRQNHERQRPSTSAGEYHYNLPAPFMSPIGTPVSGYNNGGMGGLGGGGEAIYHPLDTVPLQQTNSSVAGSWYNPGGLSSIIGGGGMQPYDSTPSSLYHHQRPVTAPSYYSATAPTFGYAHHPQPPTLISPIDTISSSSPSVTFGTSSGGGERRTSGGFGYVGVNEERFPTISEEVLMGGGGYLGLHNSLHGSRNSSANSTPSRRSD